MPNSDWVDWANDMVKGLFRMGSIAGPTGLLNQVPAETLTERKRRELEAKSAVGKLLYGKITPQPQIKK